MKMISKAFWRYLTTFRCVGVKKIVQNYTLVKPRVERVHFVEKSANDKAVNLNKKKGND
jgi:hypothetical protein